MHGDSGLRDEEVDQKYKRPDRVYGLGMTSSFTPHRERAIKASPFSGGHTLFPFLLVEAKSEKSASGFEQIQRQTALSIRTCLKLQVDLEIESNQVIEPLVWFFGFMGDEWRLYLAFMVGDETVGHQSSTCLVLVALMIAESGRLLAWVPPEFRRSFTTADYSRLDLQLGQGCPSQRYLQMSFGAQNTR